MISEWVVVNLLKNSEKFKMQNNKRHLWMLKKYKDDFEVSLKKELLDYYSLLDTLVYLNEAIKEKNIKIDYWQKYSETLLFKICFHRFSIHKLLEGFNINSVFYPKELNDKNLIDHSSVRTLLRTQLEAFLMYKYIYINPVTNDEKELRYCARIYASLYQRISYPSNTILASKQKLNDQKELDSIRNRIRKLNSFSNLSESQKKALLDKGSHKLFNHWSSILKECGYEENHIFSISYKFWSSYSHSEGVSVIQMNERSLLYNDKDTDAISDLNTSKILICNTIFCLITLFESAKSRYNNLPEEIKFNIEFHFNLTQMAVFKK